MYLPVILWYSTLSEYMEGSINFDKFTDVILKSGKALISNKYKSQKISDLLNDLAFNLPNEIKSIQSKLGLS
jgi:hypothetical protein